MKQKTLGIIFLVAIAAAVVSGIYYWQVANQPVAPMPVHIAKCEKQSNDGFTNLEPASLDKTNGDFYLTLNCRGKSQTYLVHDSKLSLDKLSGQSVSANYQYIEYLNNDIRCVKAPCDPIKETRIKIISVVKFPVADVTSDWETYTNTQYGFEFKYPARFSNPSISSSEEGLFSGEELIQGPLIIIGSYTLVPTKDSAQKKAMQSWMKRELGLADSQASDSNGGICKKLNVPDLTIHIDAVHCDGSPATYGLMQADNVWVFFHSVPEIDGRLSTTAEDIQSLSSFKFTN